MQLVHQVEDLNLNSFLLVKGTTIVGSITLFIIQRMLFQQEWDANQHVYIAIIFRPAIVCNATFKLTQGNSMMDLAIV